MNTLLDKQDNLLHSIAAAKRLGVSTGWLARERWKGTGPTYIKVGGKRGRAVRYRSSDIQAWINDNRIVSTSGGCHE